MQYLMLVYADAKHWEAFSQNEQEKLWADLRAYGEEIGESWLLAGAPLRPTSTATTLRSKDDAVMVIDGPFAETKEVLAGYHLVECKDLDEAIAIGSRFPGLRVGWALEIRPVLVSPVACSHGPHSRSS